MAASADVRQQQQIDRAVDADRQHDVGPEQTDREDRGGECQWEHSQAVQETAAGRRVFMVMKATSVANAEQIVAPTVARISCSEMSGQPPDS